MDILQLRYLVTIVESGYNLTQAAQKLFISQPALSKSMTALEDEINGEIFVRLKGRLNGLTALGSIMYSKSLDIKNRYDELLEIIQFRSNAVSGSFQIGIPPLVISALFGSFFTDLKLEQPSINFDIIELGGEKLVSLLKNNKLDFSVALEPTHLDPNEFNSVILHRGDFRVYMSENNPLVNKGILTWDDLNDQNVSMCDDSFQSYYLFLNRIGMEKIKLRTFDTAFSWDFIFSQVRKSNIITVLPYASRYLFNMNGVKEMRMDKPIAWDIAFVYRKKQSYTQIERFVIEYFTSYFKSRSHVLDISEFSN